MTATLHRAGARVTPAHPVQTHAFARLGLLRELDAPRQVFSNITPNWYASIMGTGVIGAAASSLPVQFAGLVLAWVTVASRMTHGSIIVGTLFRAPALPAATA